MKKKYTCQLYNATKAFFLWFPLFIVVTAFIIFLGRLLNIQPILGVFIVIIMWVLPFAFQKKIKSNFTKNALLEFDNYNFSITTSNLNNDKKVSTLTYNWNEIKAYKFYFTPSKLTYLDIYLKDGKQKEFGFKDNKTEEESINGESIFSIFFSFIQAYNLNKEDSEKINFAPGLFVKPVGVILLFILVALIITDIILHILKYDNNIGFIIFSTTIFLGLLGRRIQQKKFYERMSRLN
jgi:Flp pilus assembly protein TadB